MRLGEPNLKEIGEKIAKYQKIDKAVRSIGCFSPKVPTESQTYTKLERESAITF